MMPERMQDQYIRVYCKQRDSDVLEALRTAFTQWCSLNRCVPPHSAGEMTPSHTPQKSHQQTSPRVSAAGPRVLNEVSCTLPCPFSLDSSPPKEKAKMQMWRHCLYKIGTGRSFFCVPTLLSLFTFGRETSRWPNAKRRREAQSQWLDRTLQF